MDTVLEEFIETLNSESTKKAYCLDLNKFINHFSIQKIFELSDEDIIQYLDSLVTRNGEKVKRTTFNRTRNSIKSFYRWLYQLEYISEPRLVDFKHKKVDKTVSNQKAISRKVFNKILKNTPFLRDKLLFTIMYEAGLKISEVLALRLFDITEEFIIVKGIYSTRRVPCTKNIYNMFNDYINHDRNLVTQFYLLQEKNKFTVDSLPLFVSNQTSRPIGYYAMNMIFKEASKGFCNSDGSPFALNQLRYSYIFSKLDTANPKELAKQIGLLDSRSLEIYERDSKLFVAKENLVKI